MSRKRNLSPSEIAILLANEDISEVEDSASENESDHDYEVNDIDESERSTCESDDDNHQESSANSNYIGKDGYIWSTEPKKVGRTPKRNLLIGKPGPKNAAVLVTSPEEAFGLFINNEMVQIITRWTNQKIILVREKFNSRQGFAYDTSESELRAFIGILLFLGGTKSSKEALSSIWAEDGTGKPLCIAAMSQKRFTFISYCLRFDDSQSREERKKNDKLAPIRQIFDMFVTACHSNYTPGPDCTVDESLLSFRGRCGFKQYIPNKPSKYGIKLFVLADNDTSYSVKSIAYTGAGTFVDQAHMDVPVPTKAVLGLVDCIEGTNRNVTTDNYCTVDESLLSFRGRCGFKQYIPNKPSKYGIKLFVLADNDTSYSVKSIAYTGAGTFVDQAHMDVPVPTKAVLGLVDCIEGTNRNVTTDNYYTSIPLAKELKSRKLTLVGTLKKNKTCIPPCFLTKSSEGTLYYGFDKLNDFTLLSVTPKKNKKVIFLSSMHQTKNSEGNKEEINLYYNKTKGGVDSHDQKCGLFTTARKTNRWPMRLFYGILDCSIVNAFVIMLANVEAFAAKRRDQRTYFMKSVARSLIKPYAQQRLHAIQTPKQVRKTIELWNKT